MPAQPSFARAAAAVRHRVHAARRAARRAGLRVLATSPRLSALWYGLGSDAFSREHHGVIWGRMSYEDAASTPSGGQYLLRRNLHMLEKGLIMSPRREVFGADYIERTVEAFAASLQALPDPAGLVANPEMVWARDVLLAYFDVAGSHPAIDRARQCFEAAGAVAGPGCDYRGAGQVFAPFGRQVSETSPVAFSDLEQLAIRRRSVRWFLDRDVPRALLDNAVRVAVQSPSACNRQPFRFAIFDDRAMVHRVASLAPGTRGFVENFPVVAVVIGSLRAYFDERDRHVIYVDGALASMGLIYALEAQGLGTCCINWPDIGERERMATSVLGLQPDERIIMLIAIGYPDPERLVPYSVKKPLDGVRTYNDLPG